MRSALRKNTYWLTMYKSIDHTLKNVGLIQFWNDLEIELFFLFTLSYFESRSLKLDIGITNDQVYDLLRQASS